jgi:dipeptidyl aminopeptidase/acylaminoacyl peptidase
MIIVLLFLALFPIAGTAQLTPEQVLSIRQISELRFSPDGAFVAFTVTEPPKGNERNRDLWLLEIASRKLRQLTFSAKPESSPKWSPEGRQLAFLSDRDGPTQIYLLRMDGGEASRLTEGKNSIQSFEWAPGGTQIAFLAPEPKSDAEEKKEKDKDDARVIDQDVKYACLWLIDIDSKKTRQLTTNKWRAADAKWLPQGDRILISATDRPESGEPGNRIYAVSASDGRMEEISAPRGTFSQLSVSPDGLAVSYLAARVDGPSPHDLYLQPLAGGLPRNLTGEKIDRPLGPYTWLKDGSILATVSSGFKSLLYRIGQDGTANAISDWPVNPSAFAAAESGTVAFVGQNATEVPELWLWNAQGNPEKVSSFQESWSKISLLKPEIIHYKSFDGTEIEASLLKPAGYQEGTRVSLIVLVHGGPTGRWSDAFENWGQLLAARGFATFSPNIRGSTGYGHRFIESNRADWGGGDFKDIQAGVDFLIQRGIADPARLGIGGWSYGGYMSAWAITQTNRFKAAVAGAGLSDLASEFGTEAGHSYDEWFFGTPYEKPDGFIKSSPITFIRNARTPTLILQGEADTTDPIGQSQQLYRGLKHYGVESEFVVYPREGHGIREEKHMLDMYKRIIAWYEKYLK